MELRTNRLKSFFWVLIIVWTSVVFGLFLVDSRHLSQSSPRSGDSRSEGLPQQRPGNQALGRFPWRGVCPYIEEDPSQTRS